MRKQFRVAVAMLVMAWSSAGCDGLPEETSPADAGTPFFVDGSPAERDAGTTADAGAVMADAGAGDDAGPPPRCIGNYAEGVAIFAAETVLALRAHADPEDSAEITAWPWQTSLGAIRPVARDVAWRVEGDTMMFRTEPLVDPRERRLRLAVAGDAFDMGGREPFVSVRACVQNPCPETATDGSPCRCEMEVCSPLLLVSSVPALDGRWMYAENGEDVQMLNLAQSGRMVSGFPFGFPCMVEGMGISYTDLGVGVIGAIAADRNSISGLLLAEDWDVLGTWSARRAD